MRRVNRGRASGLAAIVLCFLVVLSGLVILLSRSQGKEGGQSYSTQPTLNGHTKAAAIDLALASLKLGDGPARGAPVICRLAFPGAGQAGCGSTSGPPAPLPSTNPVTARSSWTRLGGSQALVDSTMAYDSGDGYVLLVSGVPTGKNVTTWTFSAGTWTNITASVGPAPPGRAESGMSDDPHDGYVVLFGGVTLNCAANPCDSSTWSYHAGKWTNITHSAGTAPSPRELPAMRYDPSNGSILLFGGLGRTTASNDTWAFSGGRWSDRSATIPVTPSPRYGASMTYDVADGSMLLFGGAGSGSSGFLGDTWKYTAAAGWKAIPTGGNSPSLRLGAAMTFDAASNRVVLFGGLFEDLVLHTEASLSDTWTFSAGNWSATASGTGPSPHGRTLANLVDDLADGYPVLYGGTDAVLEAVLGDTWSYHSGNWSLLLVPTAPPARAVPSLVDDPSDGSLLMFGGSGLNESWAYRAGNWTLQGAGATPPGRLEAGMPYDANDSEVVLFGGIGGGTGFPLLNDTWAYSAGRWTNLTSTAGGPPPLAGAMMAYDPMAKEVLLFGGESRLGYTSQTWEFSRGHWTNLTGGLTTSPPGRGFGMMTFDGADNYLLLVGGIGPPSPLTGFCDYLCGDSWEFTNGAWTQLHPSVGPPPSDGAGMAYDPILRQVVLFGGTGEHRSASSGSVAYLNETWTYAGGLWSNLTSSLSVSPPPQDTGTGVNLVFDSHDGYTFAFEGGFPGSSWWKFGNRATSPLSVSIPYGTPGPLSLGQPITIGASVGGGVSPYSYTWTGLPAGCHSANRSSFSCTPSADGNFTIRVTVTDAAGMVQPSPALQLFIDAAFARVAISPDPALLPPNGTLVLTATPQHADGSAVPGAVTYDWSVDPSNLGALTTREGSSTTFAAGKSAGTVTVYVNATFGGATEGASQKVAIAIAPLVVTSFTVVPSTLGLNGGPVTFTVVPAGGTPPYSYRYVGLPPGCSSANQSVLNCTVHSAGNWNVTLLLSDSGRHQTSANVLLRVAGMGAGGGPSVWSIPIVQWAGLLVVVIVVAIVAVVALMGRRRVPPPLSARPPPG